MGVIADMAPRADTHALRERLVSAAILLPVVAAAIWLGSYYWDALVGVFAVVIAWEWAGMCARGQSPPRGTLFGIAPAGLLSILAVAVAVVAAALHSYNIALLLAIAGACLSTLIATRGPGTRSHWHGLGALYAGLPSVAVIAIREQPGGLAALVWILALVIATDTGAYAAGRAIGGPRLAPRISPNKTWAGLLGGIFAAVIVGWIGAIWLTVASITSFVLASALLAIVEQAGDLVESGFKRYFGVKDSSHLIPGHGGFLDRADGFLAVALAVALAQSVGGGLLTWTR
jgi:phosphatidate cytidylyltransferase